MKKLLSVIPAILLFASCSEEQDQNLSTPNVIPKIIARQSCYRILAIGNSFTEDATRHIPSLLNNNNENDVYFAILTRGGSSLQNHWDNHLDNKTSYSFKYCFCGEWLSADIKTVNSALDFVDWDIVVLQQVSDLSGDYSTYQPYLDNLIQLSKDCNEDPLIAWNMTWAYSSNSSHPAFSRYGKDRSKMYESIENAVLTMINDSTGIDIVIPTGRLIENLRYSHFNTPNDLTRDGYHLDKGFPCLMLSYLWHEMLITPNTSVSVFPDSLSAFKDSIILGAAPNFRG